MFLTHLVIGAFPIIICIWALLRPIQKISLTNPMTKPLVYLGILVTLIILYVSLAYSFNFEDRQISSHPSDWGVFGDFLGGVLNPVLSFITVILLLWNIYIQKQDNQKNNFDRMFTLMLEQHNSYLDKPEFSEDVSNVYGELLKLVDSNIYNSEQLNNIFNQYPVINTYLRFLYRVLKYLTKENQAAGDYSRLLRSFCSEQLLFIIAVNSLRTAHNKDFIKYQKLIEQNNFLEHMDLQYLFNNWSTYMSGICENLQKMKIEKKSDETFIFRHYQGDWGYKDIYNSSQPMEKTEVVDIIKNYTTPRSNNLFIDIIKLDKSAFNNSDDYNRCIKDKITFENDLNATIENKIKQLDKL